MAGFDTAQKNMAQYLDSAANGSGLDKSWLTLEALKRVPGLRDHVRLVEIGPGGGVALEALTDSIQRELPLLVGALSLDLIELDGIESLSLRRARESFSRIGTSRIVRADARDLDGAIGNDNADVVTACAVYHEVYSYCGGETALNDAFLAANRTLSDGGFLAYRDIVALPSETLHDSESAEYSRPSWVQFMKLFLPHYLDGPTHPYGDDVARIQLKQNERRVAFDEIRPDTTLSMIAPAGLFRELQRHYITMRDYMWRNDAVGVSPILDGANGQDWIDRPSGHRRIHFDTSRHDLSRLGRDEQGHYVIDGDVFEDIVDDALYDVLLAAELDEESRQASLWKQWLDREGRETYVYATVDEIVSSVATNSYQDTDGERILMPQYIGKSPRPHYTRYVRRVLPNGYYDGGQRILFQALDPHADDMRVEQARRVVSRSTSKSTLATIDGLTTNY
jgi:hypothetical protein